MKRIIYLFIFIGSMLFIPFVHANGIVQVVDVDNSNSEAMTKAGYVYYRGEGVDFFADISGAYPKCASYNGRDCLWRQTNVDASRLIPLKCGEKHAEEHGSTGYASADHWCYVLSVIANGNNGDGTTLAPYDTDNSLNYDNAVSFDLDYPALVLYSGDNPVCLSPNGRDCYWGDSIPEDGSNIKQLICGPAHKAIHGVSGYESADHWCYKLANLTMPYKQYNRLSFAPAKKVFMIYNPDTNECVHEDTDSDEKGDSSGSPFHYDRCDLKSTSWFIQSAGGISSAYSRRVYPVDLSYSYDLVDYDNDGEGTYTVSPVYGAGSVVGVDSDVILNGVINVRTIYYVDYNIDNYAELFVSFINQINEQADSDEIKQIFINQKSSDINKIHGVFFRGPHYVSPEKSLSLQKNVEEGGYTLNVSAAPYELGNLLNIETWRDAFESAQMKSITPANLITIDKTSFFLKRELIKNIYHYIDSYVDSLGKKHQYTFLNQFFMNLTEDSLGEININAHNGKIKLWAKKIFILAYDDIVRNYANLIQTSSFSKRSALKYIVAQKFYLGDAFINVDGAVFSNNYFLEAYHSMLEKYKKDYVNNNAFFGSLNVYAYRAKIILVATYIRALLGEEAFSVFESNLQNGYKMHNAASQIYRVILDEYVPGIGTEFNPTIALAMITRDLYKEQRSSRSSTEMDSILQAQEALTLAYKVYPYFQKQASIEIRQAKQKMLARRASQSKFSKLLESIGGLFMIDMAFGFINVLEDAFLTDIEDFSVTSAVNDEVFEEATLEEGAVESEIIGAEAGEGVTCF